VLLSGGHRRERGRGLAGDGRFREHHYVHVHGHGHAYVVGSRRDANYRRGEPAAVEEAAPAWPRNAPAMAGRAWSRSRKEEPTTLQAAGGARRTQPGADAGAGAGAGSHRPAG
jgi:hypothetical protein